MTPIAPSRIRNPFGVLDVPDPNDQAVEAFALATKLGEVDKDQNSPDWSDIVRDAAFPSLEGAWASRWNGGADPTIPGDAKEAWKTGVGEVKLADGRIYLLFNWDGGARQGLIDARVETAGRLVGKYINLSAPEITRPRVGQVVDNRRVDGCWTSGCLDFRR